MKSPTFFLIIINSTQFKSKYQAVQYMEIVRKFFKQAMIKMINKEHQDRVVGVKEKRVDLKLWGLGRKKRDLVYNFLLKYLPKEVK